MFSTCNQDAASNGAKVVQLNRILGNDAIPWNRTYDGLYKTILTYNPDASCVKQLIAHGVSVDTSVNAIGTVYVLSFIPIKKYPQPLHVLVASLLCALMLILRGYYLYKFR